MITAEELIREEMAKAIRAYQREFLKPKTEDPADPCRIDPDGSPA